MKGLVIFMKNLRVALSLLLTICLVFTLCGSVFAAELTREERIDKAFDYVVANYLPKFGDEYTADLWSLFMGACAEAEPEEMLPLIPIYKESDFTDTTKLVDIAKAVIVIEMTGKDMHALGSLDLTSVLLDEVNKNLENMSIYELAYTFAALHLTQTEFDAAKVFEAIEKYASKDGGYSWEKNADTGDVDVTGVVTFAISDYEKADDALATRISSFLASCLDDNNNYVSPGGFTWDDIFYPNQANCNTQAMAIIALVSMGKTVSDDAYAALGAYQTEDGGFKYQSFSNAPDYLSTNQAILALGFAKIADNLKPEDPVTSDPTSSDVSSEDVTSDVATSDTSSTTPSVNNTSAPTTVKPATQAPTNNNTANTKTTGTTTPNTGDDGVKVIVIGAAVAVAAVLVCVLIPIIKKGKKKDDDFDDYDDGDDE